MSSKLPLFLRKKLSKKLHALHFIQHKRHWRVWFMWASISMLSLFLVVGTLSFIWLVWSLPNIDDPQYLQTAKSTIIYDKEGNELYTIHGGENRKIIDFQDIPDHLKKAAMAIEDDGFYNHIGIDIGAIVKAACHEFVGNLGGLCPQRGGSTITQQIAKNIFLDNARRYSRKAKEILLALKLEQRYSKDEILALYLNLIPFGNNAYGVESAANLYFGKNTKDLTIAESAILVSLPNAPTRYSPYGQNRYSSLLVEPETILEQGRNIQTESDLEVSEIQRGLLGKLNQIGENSVYIRGRTDLVLARMAALEMITAEEKDQAWQETQEIEFKQYREPIKHPHFVFYVKEQIEKKYGKDLIEQGGLKVYTTIDPNLQNKAEEIIIATSERNESAFGSNNASLVSINPNNGHIVSMVGSKDYFDAENDGNVNVALQPRLPGSSFKPFAFAASFLKGYAPATVVYDVETDFGGGYKPQNFDGRFIGPVTMRKALGHSLNIPAVKAAILADVPNVIDLAKKMGIQFYSDESRFGSSLALGAGEVRLLDLVSAYGVFAKNGIRHEPVSILKIIDSNGAIIEEWQPAESEPEPVISPQLAYLMNHVLSDPGARGPGWNSRLQINGQINGVKTGTANKKKGEIIVPADAWTVGYTTHLVTGVWSGNNDGSPLASAASGFTVAAPIWHQFMTHAHEELEQTAFPVPEGIRKIVVSSLSGKLVSDSTPADKQRVDVFADFNIPTQVDDSFIELEIDKFSGLLASDECPAAARETKLFFNAHSVKPDWPNWEDPVRQWARAEAIKQSNGESSISSENEDGEQKILSFELPPVDFCVIEDDSPRNIEPEVLIVSPRNNDEVSTAGIGVWVDLTASFSPRQVEYYFNDELIYTANSEPFKGSLSLPDGIDISASHTIRAVVTDFYYNQAEDSIRISFAKDTQKPNIEILSPRNNQRFQVGQTIEVEVDARDQLGDIDNVELFIGEKLVAKRRNVPFTFSIRLPRETGEFTITAKTSDRSRNNNQTSIQIYTQAEKVDEDTNPDLNDNINTDPSEGVSDTPVSEENSDSEQNNATDLSVEIIGPSSGTQVGKNESISLGLKSSDGIQNVGVTSVEVFANKKRFAHFDFPNANFDPQIFIDLPKLPTGDIDVYAQITTASGVSLKSNNVIIIQQ